MPLKHPSARALRQAALAYPETVEDFPWGHSAFKVGGKKAFCFLSDGETGGFSCSMKLPFRADDALQHAYAARTGYGLGSSGWVTFTFTRTDKAPDALLADWLDESWRAIAPKKLSGATPIPKTIAAKPKRGSVKAKAPAKAKTQVNAKSKAKR